MKRAGSSRASKQSLHEVHGRQAAITICEDAWNDKQFWERRLYLRDPVEELAQSGAEVAAEHQRLAVSHGKARTPARICSRAPLDDTKSRSCT